MIGRYGHELTHAAVTVNTEYIHLAAAVRARAPAGNAGAAFQIGQDCDFVPQGKTGGIFSDFNNFSAQLMAKNPWVGEIRLVAGKGMNVRAADADSLNTDEQFALCWHGRLLIALPKFSRLNTGNGPHMPSLESDAKLSFRPRLDLECKAWFCKRLLCFCAIQWRQFFENTAPIIYYESDIRRPLEWIRL